MAFFYAHFQKNVTKRQNLHVTKKVIAFCTMAMYNQIGEEYIKER